VNSIELLKQLYAVNSKHSNYQILSNRLSELLDENLITVNSRYEKERLEYIFNKISVKDKRVLDIGGNTGYFSFEILEHGASNVHYFEGNKHHAEFVKLAANELGYTDKISINNEYYTFKQSEPQNFHITLLLNVLHHIGDDYGDKSLNIKKAKENILKQINAMANKTEYLIFQLGFCWQGNIKTGLFEQGTKLEMLDYLDKGTRQHWDILHIGIAEKNDGNVIYADINTANEHRNDALGEFLNRPLLILRSKT